MEMNDFLKALQKHCCKPIIFRVDEPFLKVNSNFKNLKLNQNLKKSKEIY